MGCLFSFFFRSSTNSDVEPPPQRKAFSWEQPGRANIRKEDFILDKLKDQTIFRLPGSINGQQFIIQNCENCTVYVFDHTGQVQIDDCTNCRFFIGPVCGSLSIRDSTDCVLATVCKQFRTRDVRNIYAYLSCASQPIIESSHNIKFGCLTLNYKQLAEQYQAAGISPWNNNWSNIHDFTSIPDGKNYSLLKEDEHVLQHLPIPTDPSCSHLNIKDDHDTSVTPFTYGELHQYENGERCLVVFFNDPNADAMARELISMSIKTGIELVKSKSYTIDESNAERMFQNNTKYQPLVKKGPVIGLEYAGDACVTHCQTLLEQLKNTKFPNTQFFVSQTPADALGQIEKFYNFASMQMFS